MLLMLQIGVELGVQKGKYALKMLESWPSCERYYLVDLWAHQVNYRCAAGTRIMRMCSVDVVDGAGCHPKVEYLTKSVRAAVRLGLGTYLTASFFVKTVVSSLPKWKPQHASQSQNRVPRVILQRLKIPRPKQ